MTRLSTRSTAKANPESSEAKLRAILETAVDAIITIDRSGTILSVNPAAGKMFGYLENELPGHNVEILIPPSQRAFHSRALARYSPHPNQKILCPGNDGTGLRKDGTTFPLEMNVSMFQYNGGMYFTGIIRDITERHNAQAVICETIQKIEKSHLNLRAIMDLLEVGIISVDTAGNISFLNMKVLEMLGKKPGDLIGESWTTALPFRPDDILQVKTLMESPATPCNREPIMLTMGDEQIYCLEITVRDAPTEFGRKILILEDVTEIHQLRSQLNQSHRFHNLVGKSDSIQQVFQIIRDIATVDWTVLIEGETGTGKELAARAIHAASHRKNAPFIAVNCAGLTDTLLASQLFGHKRGSFSGAVADQRGFFEAANGGTLFLDEIGDISKSLQTSLLRVLEEKHITRLGETKPRKVDVRILVATNRDLAEEVEKGNFRTDLLYRLRVGRIRLPALRERREDIPLLCHYFLAQSCTTTGKAVRSISEEALGILLDYHWPGNVRELKSAVDFATLHCRGDVIRPGDLPPEIRTPRMTPGAAFPEHCIMDERQEILVAIARARGNRTRAARELGISRATLYRRMRELGIELPRQKIRTANLSDL